MQNIARVMIDVAADVLGVVEAENRPALLAFSTVLIARLGGAPYRHAMLIDGNDDRGIDVGVLTGEQPTYRLSWSGSGLGAGCSRSGWSDYFSVFILAALYAIYREWL